MTQHICLDCDNAFTNTNEGACPYCGSSDVVALDDWDNDSNTEGTFEFNDAPDDYEDDY